MWPAQVVVITLARRAERRAAFRARWARACPGTPVTVLAGTDEASIGAPPGWEGHPVGTWGCWHSHLRALRTAEATPVLVLEDDAVFIDGFPAALARIDPPDDWDLVHLGGQHLISPRPVGGDRHVVAPVRTIRSHAYLTRRPARVAAALAAHPTHLDWALARAGVVRYAAAPWLVGQDRRLPSDVTGGTGPGRVEFWQEAARA